MVMMRVLIVRIFMQIKFNRKTINKSRKNCEMKNLTLSCTSCNDELQ